MLALLAAVLLSFSVLNQGAVLGQEEAVQSHPKLFFGADDIPALREKLGGGKIGGPGGPALTALLQGKRDEASIEKLFSADKAGMFEAAFIYDFQYPFMTEDERAKGRELLLVDADALRQKSVTSKAWYFTKYTNNWIICPITNYAMQRILVPGILFPDDPRSGALRKRGEELLMNFLQDPETAIEFIEESLTAVNGYGLYDLNGLSFTMMILDRNAGLVDIDAYEHRNRFLYAEGRYRTYLYQDTATSRSKLYGCAGAPPYTAGIYGVPLGGHGGYTGHPMVPGALEFLAGAYKDPVLAWLCLKAAKRDAWAVGANYADVRDLLFRGCVEPKSPAEAEWPLSAYFPKAGVFIMRKNWAPDGSVVVCHSGWAGSHYQPCQGQVVFTGQGYTVLGKASSYRGKDAPRWTGYWQPGPSMFYTASPYANNILIVDGKAQTAYRALKGAQRDLGDMEPLGPDAVVMDPVKAYADAKIQVAWKRTVRYDREADMVVIEDAVEGGEKELTFNWVTAGKVLDNYLYDMPGPYFMAARLVEGDGELQAENVTHFDHWPTIQVKSPAGRLRILWIIAPGEDLAKGALAENHSKLGLSASTVVGVPAAER